ncbi:MAG: glucosaminidase domain-containing protein [Clostridium sp.]|uniref:glucosaminidase domain-containing protein n=1 Tax=Clostridium sp. TaxID=1506 RepID=UPI003F315736
MKKFLIGSGLSFTFLVFPILFLLLIMGGENSTPIPENVNVNEQQAEFIAKVLPGAIEGWKKYKVLPSVTLAQAILESGWGKSGASAKYNNCFGIKADSSWKGKKIDLVTTEYVNGGSITIVASFRVYDSWDESVADHAKFLAENKRYAEAGFFKAKDPLGQFEALQRAGYATSSTYAKQLMEIVLDYGLNIYDGGGNIDIKPGKGKDSIDKAINSGKSIVGSSPYCFGAGRNDYDVMHKRFDCSSFVYWCYENAGIKLGARENVTTWSLLGQGKKVDGNKLKVGDLVFFDTMGANTHVGIYIGNRMFINDSTSKGVSIASLDNSYWKSCYKGTARRIVGD